MSSTIPELLLTENKIELLEPYTLAKKHHKMRCTVCGHKWSATPLSKRQTYKKWGVGGCPECKKSRCEELYKIKRAQNLELLQKKGLKILSRYDGRRTNKKIKFQNEKCGHIFKASANNMIYSQTSCIVCGAASRINAATAWSKANSQKWRETAEDWLLYKSHVTSITEKNYRKYHKQINPSGHVRALAGVKGAYHLDHIVSVRMCYDNNVPVELCASVDNLQMLPWTDNVTNRQYIKGTISSKFHQYFDCYVRIQPYVAELRKLMPYSRVNHDIGQGIVATIYSASQNLAIFIHPLDTKLANQKILAQAREHCVTNEIDYIMLFEDELNQNFSLVISKIKHKLAKSNGIRIHARKCTIAEVDNRCSLRGFALRSVAQNRKQCYSRLTQFPKSEAAPLPKINVLIAAFTSRSCVAPQLHSQFLTTSPSKPFGPLREPQLEQVWVENLLLTLINSPNPSILDANLASSRSRNLPNASSL